MINERAVSEVPSCKKIFFTAASSHAHPNLGLAYPSGTAIYAILLTPKIEGSSIKLYLRIFRRWPFPTLTATAPCESILACLQSARSMCGRVATAVYRAARQQANFAFPQPRRMEFL